MRDLPTYQPGKDSSAINTNRCMFSIQSKFQRIIPFLIAIFSFVQISFSTTVLEFGSERILFDGLDQVACDNVTNGGEIAADEFGCPNPTWDPSLITNVTLPSGGTGDLEYIWIYTTDDPASPGAFWSPIIGSNSPEYDPDPISETTYFRRCARRSGCTDYIAESNIIVKESICCDNVTDGGMIAADQVLCDTPFVAAGLTNTVFPTGGNMQPIEYQWAQSTTNSPYTPTNPDWSFITGANDADYDPGAITQTTYFVRLSRRYGCLDYDGVSNIIVIHINDGISAQVSSQDVSCDGGSDGSVQVDVITGGAPGYTLAWVGFPGETDSMLIDLSPGTYEVIITDAVGCTGSAIGQVADADSIEVSTSSTDATCDDSSDGTATAQVNGGTAPYTYEWDDPLGQTNATAANLAMGSYTVTVTDNNGCTQTATVTVGAPMEATLVLTPTDASCFGLNDGAAEVSVLNGNINDYSVTWSNGENTSVITDLTTGTYTVTVTDANGCTVEGSTIITEPMELILMMDADSASCFSSSDGTASVTVSGGVPFPNNDYEYIWDASGNPTVSMLDDVSPGNYTVTVTDANGCTSTNSVEIGAPDEIQITFNSSNVSCNGLTDGSVSTQVSGGVSPYTYLWNDTGNSTTPDLSDLAPGAYTLSVTDANSCLSTAILNIMEPTALALDFNIVDVVCEDDTDGVAVAVPSGGTAPYSILWENGVQTQAIFDVGVGNYNVTITDNNGCQISGTASVSATTTLSSSVNSFDATCFDVNNGVAIANGVNGTPPYSYLWSNGATTNQIDNLFFGSYEVTITDSDGCSVTNTAVVNSPPLLSASIQVLTEVETYGGTEGSAIVSGSGGLPPYSLVWDNGTTNDQITGLGGGTHSVTITDANNCFAVAQITLVEPSKIGDYVWDDENQNGIQDGNEVGIEGVNIFLVGVTSNGDSIDLTTVSDTAGYYAFDGLTSGAYQLEFETPTNYVFTYQNIGNDVLDSDADANTGLTQNFPITQGEFESRWDCGMILLDEKIDIGDKVWFDTDHNGIQGLQEAGVEGVVVRLREMPANQIIAQDITDILGNYLFEDVLPGSYIVEFSPTSFPPGGFLISPKDQGSDDTKDSDANIATGLTDEFQVFPFTLDNLTIDMGIYKECDNITDGGVIGYDEELCGVGADPSEIVNVVFPSGGFGTIEYLWMQSVVPIYNGPGDPNWTIIPNSNSPNYDPGPIGQSTYYIRCARREGCDDYIGESNVVAKEITPFPLAQIIDAPNLICQNEESRFEAAIAGAGATYFWEFPNGGSPSTATTRVADPVSWSSPGVKTVTLTVTRFGCSFSVTTNVIIDDCVISPLIVFDDVVAEIQGESVQVKWNVKGDTENTIFYVERSEDGQEFTTLDHLLGQEGTEQSSYEYMDDLPKFGENIYRIKFDKISANGQVGISKTTMVMFQLEPTQMAQVFPNPTSGNVTVELLKSSNEPSIGEVRTPFGKTLFTFKVHLPGHSNRYHTFPYWQVF
ncbi:MAG: SdrD B-like domain-containing protein [Bacteroidota bacterium]